MSAAKFIDQAKVVLRDIQDAESSAIRKVRKTRKRVNKAARKKAKLSVNNATPVRKETIQEMSKDTAATLLQPPCVSAYGNKYEAYLSDFQRYLDTVEKLRVVNLEKAPVVQKSKTTDKRVSSPHSTAMKPAASKSKATPATAEMVAELEAGLVDNVSLVEAFTGPVDSTGVAFGGSTAFTDVKRYVVKPVDQDSPLRPNVLLPEVDEKVLSSEVPSVADLGFCMFGDHTDFRGLTRWEGYKTPTPTKVMEVGEATQVASRLFAPTPDMLVSEKEAPTPKVRKVDGPGARAPGPKSEGPTKTAKRKQRRDFQRGRKAELKAVRLAASMATSLAKGERDAARTGRSIIKTRDGWNLVLKGARVSSSSKGSGVVQGAPERSSVPEARVELVPPSPPMPAASSPKARVGLVPALPMSRASSSKSAARTTSAPYSLKFNPPPTAIRKGEQPR